jgi:hypothetical protein
MAEISIVNVTQVIRYTYKGNLAEEVTCHTVPKRDWLRFDRLRGYVWQLLKSCLEINVDTVLGGLQPRHELGLQQALQALH